MNHIIFYSISGIIFTIVLWAVLYFSFRRLRRRHVGEDADRDSFRQLAEKMLRESSFSWAVTVTCLILTGLLLVIVAATRSSRDYAGELMDFFGVFGGTVLLTLLMPMFWLMTRNKELEAEITVRKEKEQALEAEIALRKEKEMALEKALDELSHALAEVKTAQRQLVESERLKALGEMASGIAHDFNNTMMPILGYSGMLLSDPKIFNDREEAMAMIRNIATAANDAREIVRRLREFYINKDDEPYEPVDLNEIITSSVSLSRPKWRAEKGADDIHIDVRTELGQVPLVRGKESSLREVLINLILNAVDAMPSGGTITIKSIPEDKWAVIEVADTGMGMTEEVRQRCFHPFFTTKEKGSGLGLSMVLGIIKRHRGEVDVRSTQGKGTTIILRLPLAFGEAVSGKSGQLGQELFVKPLRVLVVDDNQSTRSVLGRYLKADRHTMDGVATGAECLDKLKEATFDLVILDRAMPDMGGDKLAVLVNERLPAMPIIMLTGFGEVMKERNEIPRGVDLVLSKPVSYRELQEALIEVVERTARGRATSPGYTS